MSRLIVFVAPLLLGFVLFGSFFVVLAQRPDPPPQPNQGARSITTPQAGQPPRTQRIREGTEFKNMLVFFSPAGDRTVLHTVEGNQRYVCLENLALERILTAIQEKPERRYWRIEGSFSEFRGANFVFIRHYVIAQAPAAVVPAAP